MTPRNTRTGGVLEQMVLPALDQGGYGYKVQVKIGQRLGCGQHFVDVIAQKDGPPILISMKWQQVSGTAEQKVPFEVISLADAVQKGGFARAYLVLGGEGWTLRDFYTEGGLKSHLVDSDKVEIVKLEHFIATANRGQL